MSNENKQLPYDQLTDAQKREYAVKKMQEAYALAEYWRKIKIELENKLK